MFVTPNHDQRHDRRPARDHTAASDRPYKIIENLCVGCKVCVKCCHVGAVIDHIIDCEINPTICIGCGRCAYHCPNNAIVKM